MKDLAEEALEIHKKYRGKLAISSKIPLKSRKELSLVYTPGVAEVSNFLLKHPEKTAVYTFKGNSVAVVSDGSAVLGLGNVGPYAALPVMEGKCVLFKHFANIDAVPIVVSTQDPKEIIAVVKAIAPTFGGINLEDIAAPACFEVEETLKRELDIPVIHDDQWGAAVVVLAALINSLKLVGKKFESARVVISGAGAAGTAIAKILHAYGAKNILVIDRAGIIFKGREGNNEHKETLAAFTNKNRMKGSLNDALNGADIFVGVSKPRMLTSEMVASMADKPIVFGLANPIPEIMPEEAKKGGAFIYGSGRSDFPNQVNNALAFPGIFRGALDNNVKQITTEMFIAAAEKLASLVKKPTRDKVVPSIFDRGVVQVVASAIVG